MNKRHKPPVSKTTRHTPPAARKTSWGKVAQWYDTLLEENDDSYQSQVILPNVERILSPKKGDRILDLACGQGYFSRALAKHGATVVGSDIARELITFAREHSDNTIEYHVAPADNLSFAKAGQFNQILCILALQNIENLNGVMKEARRVLSPDGHFLMVVNHPVLRIPKRSSWGFDQEAGIQYRRLDGYLSGGKIAIDMEPGKAKSKQTISYHRSLQDFFKAITHNGFVVTRLEEWSSHKKSGKGPRQKAEDIARREFPLFMAIECQAL